MPNLGALREEYLRGGLSRENLNENPIEQFSTWFQQALDAEIAEPNAMTLATVDPENRPWQRTVLLKAYDEHGFVFYTNYESRKAKHLLTNPHASILFPWVTLERQVIINGIVEKVSTAESLKYFVSRPFSSRLGAWVSQQSSVISSRSLLEAKLQELKNKFKDGDVPLPSFWGGYRIKPTDIEFWQGGAGRVHDRFLYSKASNGNWEIDRLAP
ncbi:pyridoxamine 5'-phosphate oxidase [Puniceicoccaceae bacterium K14]|nr:pyridoxamine 5'-phosphate oxidase [Puniceicoccaceae bacterium K14]